ncbi:hypothetical protein NL676_026681 [Syzygium grande]|nr:hypothetical protein NL676_026681 [Syzygium grande]
MWSHLKPLVSTIPGPTTGHASFRTDPPTPNCDLNLCLVVAIAIGASVVVLRAEAAHVGQVLGPLDHIPEARLVATAPTQFASAPRAGIAGPSTSVAGSIAVLALAKLLPGDALAALLAAAAAATPVVGLIVKLNDGDGGPVGGGGDDEEEGQARCGDLETCPILCTIECLVETKIRDHYE